MPGKTTIAAHVDHVHYGFSLMNRWASGEANSFAGADWNASWQRGAVNDDQWRRLRESLRHEAEKWRNVVQTRTSWDDRCAMFNQRCYRVTPAIRQILAALGDGAPA
jgi:hypothetical protein